MANGKRWPWEAPTIPTMSFRPIFEAEISGNVPPKTWPNIYGTVQPEIPVDIVGHELVRRRTSLYAEDDESPRDFLGFSKMIIRHNSQC